MKNYLLTGYESERLRFRKLTTDDFDTWLPFHQNPKSNSFWAGLPEDPMLACQHWFDKAFDRYKNGLGGMNVLIDKETAAFIGQCGLLIQTVDGIEELEIGYSLLPQYWKQGYAIEAARKCKAVAQERNLAKSLISVIHIDNVPSQKVAIKNGMFLDKTTVYNNNEVHVYRIIL